MLAVPSITRKYWAVSEPAECTHCGKRTPTAEGTHYLNDPFCSSSCQRLFQDAIDRLLWEYEGSDLTPSERYAAAREQYRTRGKAAEASPIDDRTMAELDELRVTLEADKKKNDRTSSGPAVEQPLPKEPAHRPQPAASPPPKRRPDFWDTGTPYSGGGAGWKIVGWGIVTFTVISIIYVVATGDWTNSCRGTWWEC